MRRDNDLGGTCVDKELNGHAVDCAWEQVVPLTISRQANDSAGALNRGGRVLIGKIATAFDATEQER